MRRRTHRRAANMVPGPDQDIARGHRGRGSLLIDRDIPASAVNFRDLGGHRAGNMVLRSGRVFRSALTPRGDPAALRWIERHGIKTIYDLRSAGERETFPHCCADDSRFGYIVHDHDRISGNLMAMLRDRSNENADLRNAMFDLYRRLPFEFSIPYGQLLTSIATRSLPVMFNCTAGKDRTGVATAILLSILGVSRESIIDDYLETRRQNPAVIDLLRRSGHRDLLSDRNRERWMPLVDPHEDYLSAMFDSISKNNISVEDYALNSLHLSATMIDRLRSRLLESRD